MAVRRLSRNSPTSAQKQQQQQQQQETQQPHEQQPVTKRRGRRRQQAIPEQPNGLDRVFIWDIDGSLMRADIVENSPLSSSVLASVTDKLSSLSKQLKQMTIKFCEESLCLNEIELSDQMHIDCGTVCNPPEEETATPITANVEPDQWPPPQQLIPTQHTPPLHESHAYHQLPQSTPLHQNHQPHLHMLTNTNHDHNHNFHHEHNNYNHHLLADQNQWQPQPQPQPQSPQAPQPASQPAFQLQDNQAYHQPNQPESIHHTQQTHHLHMLASSHHDQHQHNFHPGHLNYNHNSLSDQNHWQHQQQQPQQPQQQQQQSSPPSQQTTQQNFQLQDSQLYHQSHQPDNIHHSHQSHLHMLVANHEHNQNFHHDHQNHHINSLNEHNHWAPPSPPPPQAPPQASSQQNFLIQDGHPYHQSHPLDPIHHTHQSHFHMLVSSHDPHHPHHHLSHHPHHHHHHFHHGHPSYHLNSLNESNHWPQSSPPQIAQQSVEQNFQIQDSHAYHHPPQPEPIHHNHQTHLHMLATSQEHHQTAALNGATISNASETEHSEPDVKPIQEPAITKVDNAVEATTANLRVITHNNSSSNNNNNNNSSRQVSQKLSDRFYRMKTVYNQYRSGIPAIQAICCDSYKSAEQQNRVIGIIEILDEIDHFTLDWRKHSLDCLKLISASPNCTNIIITRMPLVIALGHLVCLGFSHFFDIDQVYSSSRTSKETCIKRIRKRFGASNRCSYIIIGDKDDVDMAKKLDLPYWNTSRSDGHRQLMQLHTALKEGYLM